MIFFKLHPIITYYYWFGDSKGQVQGQDCLQICFCIRNLFLYQSTVFKKPFYQFIVSKLYI